MVWIFNNPASDFQSEYVEQGFLTVSGNLMTSSFIQYTVYLLMLSVETKPQKSVIEELKI